jgi:hypothetical protein
MAPSIQAQPAAESLPELRLPLTDIRGSARAHAVLGRRVYDFYRCGSCHRLITQPEMIRRLEASTGDDIRVCPCGGLKFFPAGPGAGLRWYHWLLPRVLVFAVQRWRGVA